MRRRAFEARSQALRGRLLASARPHRVRGLPDLPRVPRSIEPDGRHSPIHARLRSLAAPRSSAATWSRRICAKSTRRCARAPSPSCARPTGAGPKRCSRCARRLPTRRRCLAVGDIHLENFGTWRDADGRLVWGVNDFDEAADMPYVLDLIRLATSALVAGAQPAMASGTMCSAILQRLRRAASARRGPSCSIATSAWLRELVVVSDKQRAKFWKKIDARSRTSARRCAIARPSRPPCPNRHCDEDCAPGCRRRQPGPAALGRRRRLARRAGGARGQGRWSHRPGACATARARGAIRCGEIADGRFRAIDPWYRVTGGIVVRRLSPNNRKIEARDNTAAAALRADAARDGPRARQRPPRHWASAASATATSAT